MLSWPPRPRPAWASLTWLVMTTRDLTGPNDTAAVAQDRS
jgi:hypothetical protein